MFKVNSFSTTKVQKTVLLKEREEEIEEDVLNYLKSLGFFKFKDLSPYIYK
jgi:hypothetical protein